MILPTNWNSLSPAEQLFTVTNLERTVRGLPPLSAMATALDVAAVQAASVSTDPAPPPGFPWTEWAGNSAITLGNPLEAIYEWMYDDGVGSPNADCSPSNTRACWGHYHNVLLPMACAPCVMGAAWGTSTRGATCMTELLVETQGSPALDFTWAQEQIYL